jgi:hypothetical protein
LDPCPHEVVAFCHPCVMVCHLWTPLRENWKMFSSLHQNYMSCQYGVAEWKDRACFISEVPWLDPFHVQCSTPAGRPRSPLSKKASTQPKKSWIWPWNNAKWHYLLNKIKALQQSWA